MERVEWDEPTNFTGRNGYMKCGGVELLYLPQNHQVMVSALTSRKDVGRCDITVPVESLSELITKLQCLQDVIQLRGRISGKTQGS